MNNPLGINFYRAVREEGDHRWIQVVVRMPLVEEEMLQKGALFGLIWGEKNDNWTDDQLEAFNFVEQEFNGHQESLAVWYEKFKNKFKGMGVCWWWVKRTDGSTREISFVYEKNSSVILERAGTQIDLCKISEESKIVVGQAREGDVWYLMNNTLQVEKFDQTMMSELWEKEGVEGAIIKIEMLELEEEKEVLPTTIDTLPEENKDIVELDKPVQIASERQVGKINMIDKFKNLFVKQDNAVKLATTKEKRISMTVGVVFVLLLLVSVGIGWKKNTNDKRLQKETEFVSLMQKKIDDAVILSKVNEDAAKGMVDQMIKDLENNKEEITETIVADWKRKLEELRLTVAKEKDLSLGEVINLDLIRSEFKGTRMQSVAKGNMLVLDGQNGLLFGVDLTKQDIKVVAGKPKTKWIAADKIGEDISLLAERSIEDDTGGVRTVFDAAVINPISLDSFGTNLYVLDQGSVEIYRYGMVSGKLGERVRWLKPGVTLGLDKPVDMAIDVDIYVVGETDKLLIYRRGERLGSPITVSEGGILTRVAVEREGDNIAVIDTKNKEIVVMKKETGERIATHKGETVGLIQDLEFDSDGSLWVIYEGKMAKIQ